GLVATLASRAAWASVPVKLLNETTRTAVFVAAGRLAAGTVPASILTLTRGVLIEMAIAKWKMAGLALLVVGVLASGAMVSAQGPAGKKASASETDRLQAVEAKLDRILRALDERNTTETRGNNDPVLRPNPASVPNEAPSEPNVVQQGLPSG